MNYQLQIAFFCGVLTEGIIQIFLYRFIKRNKEGEG